jgi:hypothetical protein
VTRPSRGGMETEMIKRLLCVILLATFALGAQEKSSGKDDKPADRKKTPFGTVKVDEKAAQSKEEPPPEMRAYEEGDNVRFERKTPFGVAKWTKKKSELDEMEKAAVERERRKPAK